ncbi:CRR6 family NdhI maturation factor [Synechococcus sp. PCC 7336]|uniref:CRR6 family NdhI maturation factor n=1 Tax=Synechococcus sp. PCC 7336 TaxID=195250 RepID=UPI00034C1B2D|nr:CRR6 family NdhI maturation factor [Synechococcus sp. PCC 7336]
MSVTLVLTADAIANLDLSAGHAIVETLLTNPKGCAQQLQCAIDYPRAEDDPRELSEISEVRLWFVRWDVAYPWLPYFLDWRGGELARYAAMLVPHQFSQREGIQFNPEGLEIFVMQKIFVLLDWFKDKDFGSTADVRNMAKVLGYDIAPEFFQLLEQYR